MLAEARGAWGKSTLPVGGHEKIEDRGQRIQNRELMIADRKSRAERAMALDPLSAIGHRRSSILAAAGGGHGGDDLMRTRILWLGMVLTAVMELAPTAVRAQEMDLRPPQDTGLRPT